MTNTIKYFLGLALLVSAMVFSGCSDDSEDVAPANVYDQIEGTWVIDQMNLFGADLPGDGSSLTFENCAEPPCMGHDYEAGDGTTGDFTYEFIENDTKIVIIDEDPEGGNYHATWSVLDFGTKSLDLTGNFGLFGDMQLEMSK